MKHSASLLYSFILLVGDFLALVAAFTLAYIVRVKLDERPLIEPVTAKAYIGIVALLLIFWIVIYSLLGLYRSQVYDNRFKEFLMLFVGSIVGILFLIGCEYVLERPIFPARLVTAYGFLYAFLLTLLFRTIARATKRILFHFKRGISRVLIIGTNDISNELIRQLSHPHSGFSVIGIVGSKRKSTSYAIPVFPNFTSALQTIGSDNVHSIVQTELYPDQEKNDEILQIAQEEHISYRFVPGNERLFVGSIEVSLFGGIPMIAVHQTALIGWGRIVKRLFDISMGVVLLIISLPVLAIIWLGLQLFGGGDAIYKQTRLSRYQTSIGLYKFRTHKHKYNRLSPEEAFNKMGKPELAKEYRANGDFLENDPRISRLGAYLRKTSLDELPQLINVIRGDISLVGPRPLVPEEMTKFKKKSVILSVKPGLTGLAVVSGRRDISFEERRKLDMYYAQNWSFWLDITILLRTVVMVLRRVGAR